MKKILLTSILFLAGYAATIAQCTINGGYTVPGIYPDTIQNLPPAYEGVAYQTVIQIRVLSDTVVPQGNVHVTNITVNNVIGMPGGFSYQCSPANCAFPGGGNGCVLLSGSPAPGSAGVYSVTINSTLNGLLFNVIPVSQAFSTLGYKIIIHPKPTPTFTASPLTVCKGGSVQFTDASSDLPSSWSWSFPGGTPSTSTLQNPVVVYNTSGLKSVTLTVGNPAGTNTLTQTNYVTVLAAPNATITLAGNDTICKGDTAILTANTGANLTYQWYKNNLAIGGAVNKVYKASATGTYKVVVTNANGCTKSSPIQKLTVNMVNAVITANGPTTFCAGGSVTLAATTGAGQTYQWYKGVNLLVGKTAPTLVATTGGSYKCLVTKNGCSKYSNIIKVIINCREMNGAISNNQYNLYPNPASDLINLNLELPETQNLNLSIYDLTGRVINKIADKTFDQGTNDFSINVSTLENGIYFLEIENNGNKEVLRFTVQH